MLRSNFNYLGELCQRQNQEVREVRDVSVATSRCHYNLYVPRRCRSS